MACERIKKLLGNNTGSSGREDEKPQSTTKMPQASTAASSTTASSQTGSSTTASSGPISSTTASSGPTSTTASSGPTSSKTASSQTSLTDFQKKIISNYENHMNRDCSFKKLSESNPNIEKLDEDILYHIALGNKSHDLQKMFKDVKFIVMGGTPKRMEEFAYYIMNEIGYELPPGTLLNDISKHSHRYAMYKVGPIMSVSHGMGMPSIGILLHELIKLVHHAGMVDPIFIRIGTCGGFSQKAGTVVISDEVVNDYLESVYELTILGANVRFPAILDQSIASELVSLVDPQDDFKTIKGKTYCTDSFYDGSGRADGAICEFSATEGMGYYENLKKNGVVNVEMESLAFAALTCRAGIKSAVMAVILSDRLETDQIKQPKEVMDEWKMRPQRLLARYIKKVLATSGISSAKLMTDATQNGQKPTVTVVTPGVTPSGKIVCPPLSCVKKSTGLANTTSQPSVGVSTQPATGRPTESSSCRSVCQKRSIPGMDVGTTGAPTKPTTATESTTKSSSCRSVCQKRSIPGMDVGTTGAPTQPPATESTTETAKSTTAAAKSDSQSGWRSCYKSCGVGSELVDPRTPHAGQQQTTVKPTIKTSDAPSKSFDCTCSRGKVAEPGQTPMIKPTSAGSTKPCSDTSAPGSATASTPAGTTSVPVYKAKDFDSSTKSVDPNDSRNAFYKNCVKVPRCDQSSNGKKRPSAMFETPMQEKTKGTVPNKAAERRPCCNRRSEDPRSPRTEVAEKQKYVEDRLEQESQASPGKLPGGGTTRRSSVPQPVGTMELGPCCTGNVKQKTPKPVGDLALGPCCTGQKDDESPPECSATVSPESETLGSTVSEKSIESPPIQSGAPTSSFKDKGREIPSDCPLVLGKKCNTNAFANNGMKGSAANPSPETPDPRQGSKGPIFSTTPIPASKTDQPTSRDQSTTVPAGSRGSCCVKSTSKNGVAAKLPTTTARQSGSSCCPKFSSAGGVATSTAKPTDSTIGQRSTAPTSKSEPKKLAEDKPNGRSKDKRTSKVQSVGGSQLGPCCAGKEERTKSKQVEVGGLGPCCTGQKDKESPPECTDARLPKSETLPSTIEEKSDESSLPKSTSADQTTDQSKTVSTDCIKLLKAKCNYKSDTENGQKVSATDKGLDRSTEDSRQSTKMPTSSTPIRGSKADPDTPQDQFKTTSAAFVTPTPANRSSCCIKSAAKNGGVSATLSSTASKSTDPQPVNGASKNCQPKSTAPASSSASNVNKYDESPSPCAACKKYQDSKIIFTGGTPSVSQPEIIKCPHKLKRLKDECQGYD